MKVRAGEVQVGDLVLDRALCVWLRITEVRRPSPGAVHLSGAHIKPVAHGRRTQELLAYARGDLLEVSRARSPVSEIEPVTDFTTRPTRAAFRDALDAIPGRVLILIRDDTKDGGEPDQQTTDLIEWLGPVAEPRIKLDTAELRHARDLPPGILVRLARVKVQPRPEVTEAKQGKGPPANKMLPGPPENKTGRKGDDPEQVRLTAAEVGTIPPGLTKGPPARASGGAKPPAKAPAKPSKPTPKPKGRGT